MLDLRGVLALLQAPSEFSCCFSTSPSHLALPSYWKGKIILCVDGCGQPSLAVWSFLEYLGSMCVRSWTENWLAARDETGFPAVLPRMCPTPPLSASSLLLISYFLPIPFSCLPFITGRYPWGFFPMKTCTCLTLPGFDSSTMKSDFRLQSCLRDSPLNNQVLSIFPHLKVLPWSQSFINLSPQRHLDCDLMMLEMWSWIWGLDWVPISRFHLWAHHDQF